MSEPGVKINLGPVDYDKLQTDDDFRAEVRRLLPKAMAEAGSAIAVAAWNGMDPGINSDPSMKQTFIEETISVYLKDVNEQKRLEQHLMAKLKEKKAGMYRR